MPARHRVTGVWAWARLGRVMAARPSRLEAGIVSSASRIFSFKRGGLVLG